MTINEGKIVIISAKNRPNGPAEVDPRLHGDHDPPQVNERGARQLVLAVSQLMVAARKHVMAAESPGLFVVSGGDVSGAEQLVMAEVAEDPQQPLNVVRQPPQVV